MLNMRGKSFGHRSNGETISSVNEIYTVQGPSLFQIPNYSNEKVQLEGSLDFQLS